MAEKRNYSAVVPVYRPLEKSLTVRVVEGIKRPCAATVVVKHDIYCYKTAVSG